MPVTTTQEFEEQLILATPLITGQKVRDAQWLLSGHNIFKDEKFPVNTLTGRIDGQYGPVTAGAAKEAKYELGYPEGSIDYVFGQVLYDYLTGNADLPLLYTKARNKRCTVTTKVEALNIAIAELGNKESYKNRTKYGEWYRFNGVPWCAIFVSWCINNALGTLNHPGWKYSYVPSISQDAAIGHNFMSITHNPQPGDLVCYTLHGEVDAHVEFYEKDLGNGDFNAVGGNTSPIDFSNGGEVARSVRHQYQVHRFVRLSLP